MQRRPHVVRRKAARRTAAFPWHVRALRDCQPAQGSASAHTLRLNPGVCALPVAGVRRLRVFALQPPLCAGRCDKAPC